MAASPPLVHELEAMSAIRGCMEYGAILLVKPSGRIGIYHHQRVPMATLRKVCELYPQIRVLLVRMAE